MAMTHIEVETVIRGYHVYKEIWTATLGEVLTCRRETAVVASNEREWCCWPRAEETIDHLFIMKRCKVILQILLRFSTHLTSSTSPHMRSSV